MEHIKLALEKLIEKHQRHKNEGKFKKINEENTKDYIDELFRILGWDFTEDVIKEYGTGKRKRVDYAFQDTGTVKFLVEAKHYNEDLDKWVKKVLEYGYQNNKTWVVLTNFKELRVYNAKYYDKEEYIRRLFEPIRIEDCVVRLDDLLVLSKEGMKKNAINQLAEKYGKIKPREPIDSLIYEDLMHWRKLLRKSIISHPRLNELPKDSQEAEDYISEAVQKMLNRIIFVRVCEDRGLEEEGMLKWCVDSWEEDKKYSLIKYLNRQFSKMNATYNSGLFAPHYSEDISVDDNTLADIIGETYESHSGLNYDFSAIDADILGAIYEQYLAYIQGRVREKDKKQKTKRKSQGIYYTPTYIVDYIVKNTLGKNLKKCKTPEDALKLKVLDPACGSGSFLIRAYDEFKDWYEKNKTGDASQTQLDLDTDKQVRTFMDRVLENCLYGVDLDEKAVEIAQLNLLLKAAEEKHKLPMLNNNIRCGNSLIDDESIDSRHFFKWGEKFSEILRSGGFDIVIGNPPWVSLKGKQKSMEISEKELNYLLGKYRCDTYRPNLFEMFIWKSLILTKNYFSFIVPDRLCYNKQFIKLRKFILDNFSLNILWFRPTFEGVISDNLIFIVNNKLPKNNNIRVAEYPSIDYQLINQNEYAHPPNFSWFIVDKAILNIFNKIKKMKNVFRLDHYFNSAVGFIAKPGKVVKNRETQSQIKVIKGEDVTKYIIKTNYFFEFKKNNLAGGTQDIDKLSKKTKLFLRKTGIDLIASLDNTGVYPEQSVYFIYVDNDEEDKLKYLCALLNSKLFNCYYNNFAITNRDSTAQLKKMDLDEFPILIKKMVEINKLVDTVISFNTKLNNLRDKNSNEVQQLKSEIEKTDKEIDDLVYEIYGITEEEKKIIEESLK